MPRRLKRALYRLFWRFPAELCLWCGADVEMDAPLRMSRGEVWAQHGERHAEQLAAELVAGRGRA